MRTLPSQRPHKQGQCSGQIYWSTKREQNVTMSLFMSFWHWRTMNPIALNANNITHDVCVCKTLLMHVSFSDDAYKILHVPRHVK